mmetsp:Transcript_38176/g.106330  ORF Transcript_38176/g.106330 Transcript_38176/m.106330 type:complete len:227 (+) Transcript_38176:86-766(+)
MQVQTKRAQQSRSNPIRHAAVCSSGVKSCQPLRQTFAERFSHSSALAAPSCCAACCSACVSCAQLRSQALPSAQQAVSHMPAPRMPNTFAACLSCSERWAHGLVQAPPSPCRRLWREAPSQASASVAPKAWAACRSAVESRAHLFRMGTQQTRWPQMASSKPKLLAASRCKSLKSSQARQQPRARPRSCAHKARRPRFSVSCFSCSESDAQLLCQAGITKPYTSSA